MLNAELKSMNSMYLYTVGTCMHVYICTHICAYMYTYMCIYVHIYVHICTHICAIEKRPILYMSHILKPYIKTYIKTYMFI